LREGSKREGDFLKILPYSTYHGKLGAAILRFGANYFKVYKY
jgi:hypothetical protein